MFILSSPDRMLSRQVWLLCLRDESCGSGTAANAQGCPDVSAGYLIGKMKRPPDL